MTRYDRYRSRKPPAKKVAPIWRGVGCLLMVVIPVISFVIGKAILQVAKSRNLIPPEILGYPKFPAWVYKVVFFNTIAQWIGTLKDPVALLIFSLAVLLLLSGLISLIYTAIYQLVGPPRYTEVDAKPSKYKAKAYKR